MRFFEQYSNARLEMCSEHSNIMSVPRISKVSINMGLKSLLTKHEKAMDFIMSQMRLITGQHPRIIKAKKSCDSFSIRKGDINALHVTIRGKRMYSFMDKLVFFVLPRSKDFDGFKLTSLDGYGNLSLGISDCTIFYEVDKRNVLFSFGFNISISTTAASNEEAKLLFSRLSFPFVS